MAINPNTDFTTGAVLTADQQNRFPRGVMAYETKTVQNTFTTEEVQATATFTAVANRYYKITFFEPYLYVSTGTPATEIILRIRKTNLAGTQVQQSFVYANSTQGNSATCLAVTTFTAGVQSVVGTLTSQAGTGYADNAANINGILMVEDIGPA